MICYVRIRRVTTPLLESTKCVWQPAGLNLQRPLRGRIVYADFLSVPWLGEQILPTEIESLATPT